MEQDVHSGQQYQAGASNFLFLNVPPVQRSPLVRDCVDVRWSLVLVLSET